MARARAGREPSTYARIAGVLFLVILVLGPFSILYVPGRLVVPGDAAATAANVASSEWLLRAAVVADAVIVLTEIGMAAVLYLLFRSVSRPLALVAAAARIAEAVVMAVNLLGYLAVLTLVTTADDLTAFAQDQREALALLAFDLHEYGVDVGQVFFGAHLLALAYLVTRSGYVPRVFGALLAVAAVGYLTDSLGHILAPGSGAVLATVVAATSVVGEVPFFLWLLVRGVAVDGRHPGATTGPAGPQPRGRPLVTDG